MTTHDYEMLGQPVGEIASNILNYDRIGDYSPATLRAVLHYAQDEQNTHLYERCHRRLQLLGELDAFENDGELCADCGAWLPFTVQAAAVDSGTVCIPCGTQRYGDRLGEYLIVKETA